MVVIEWKTTGAWAESTLMSGGMMRNLRVSTAPPGRHDPLTQTLSPTPNNILPSAVQVIPLLVNSGQFNLILTIFKAAVWSPHAIVTLCVVAVSDALIVVLVGVVSRFMSVSVIRCVLWSTSIMQVSYTDNTPSLAWAYVSTHQIQAL